MRSRSPSNIRGIDISNWQTNVNFSKVKSDGIEVIIIKATEGVNFVDKRFEEHYKGAKDQGLKLGFYHFMSDTTNPKQQAKDFWNAIKDKKFDIIPVLDIEKENQGRNSKAVTDRCIEFLNEFKSLSGYDCIIYTYTYFAKSKLDNRLKKYPLWIAHYGVNAPDDNGIWPDWVGFQYTDKGKVNGVNGNCDMNEFTNDIFINRSNNNISSSNLSSNTKKELWEVSISGSIVSELQNELNKQFRANLKVDGYFGDKTLNACINLSKGTRGNITKIVQRRLLDNGYSVGKFGVDGVFGSSTESAVRSFQKDAKLSVDGIVGKDTWKQLFSK